MNGISLYKKNDKKPIGDKLNIVTKSENIKEKHMLEKDMRPPCNNK